MNRIDVQIARAQLAELIEDKMEELRIGSYKDFADDFGIGRSTLYDIVRGRTKSRGAWVVPNLPTLLKLSIALEKPLHEIIYLVEPEAPGADTFANLPPSLHKVEVGIAGWVGAGPEQTEFVADSTIWLDSDWVGGRNLIAFHVRGDSMESHVNSIYDGDTVIVDQDDKGTPHMPVVAQLKTGGFVCKNLRDDHHEHALTSVNTQQTNGTPFYIPIDEVDHIVGRVVRIIHDL